MEIDGASNNRVDEIRILLENVQFSPSKGKYKIYIIDEVHMLSAGAFNALLKTLEEPPRHVKFIFATTEGQKVLPTIMSRCQRFDFKRISPGLILERLLAISDKEKIELDEKAALLIARAADGSLRDALVILDQMISFSGKKILSREVVELLGMVDKDIIFELTDHIIDNDSPAVLKLIDHMIDNGKDPVLITNTLISHFRDIMVLKSTKEPTADMAFSEDEIEKIEAQIDKLSQEEILYILQNLTHLLLVMKNAMSPRAPLEISLVRLTRRGDMLSISGILDTLKKKGLNSFVRPGRERAADVVPGSEAAVNPAPGTTCEKNAIGKFAGVGENNDGDFAQDEFNWKAVLKYVKNKKVSAFTFLDPAKPVEISATKAVIGFGKEHSFNKEVLEAEANRKVVEEAINRITGMDLKVEFTILDFFGGRAEEPENERNKTAEVRKKMKPVIEKAMDVFGGHVVRDYMEGV
jgi:DNA polymerase-3 subunit gamma/tau